MQEDSNTESRKSKPHPFWDSDCREKLASKPKTRTRAGGIRANSPQRRLGKKKAP